MTKDPHPEHTLARAHMDKLAKAAGMPSGQALIKHIEGLEGDPLKFLGEAIQTTIPKAPTPDATPPGPKSEPAPAEDA